MVAKSFQSLEIVGEPYTASGRKYIKVRTKTGTLKQVRWYSEAEYARMYPEISAVSDSQTKTQKEILGFEKGFITIFKGNTYFDRDYFKLNSARYHKFWGWYFISTDIIPDDIPDDVSPVVLKWEEVGKEDGSLKNENEVLAAVANLIYEPDSSEFQGEIGDKIETTVTVERAILLTTAFGISTMHVMRDGLGNCFVWTTAARSWSEGSEHHIIGTIKELKTYKNTRQTILTRCREVS